MYATWMADLDLIIGAILCETCYFVLWQHRTLADLLQMFLTPPLGKAFLWLRRCCWFCPILRARTSFRYTTHVMSNDRRREKLRLMEFGLAMTRRIWKDVLNFQSR